MRAVLDTDVVFAALLVEGLCREVFERTVKARALASSPELMAELEDLISRKLDPTPAVARFLKEYRRQARMVTAATLVAPVCRDPDDDVVLGTALAAQALVLVTGDDDLLVLGRSQGIRILTPRQFLELLDRNC